MPRELTKEQRQTKVSWCDEILVTFDYGTSKLLYEVGTGDTKWIYRSDSQNRRQTTVWVFKNEAPPTKVKPSRSNGKKMVATFCFTKSGYLVSVNLK